MRAGDKDRRVRIEVLSTSKGTMGNDIESWALLNEVWAKLTYLPIKAQEVHSGDQLLSEMFAVFQIDYIASLSPKGNRIIYQGQIYDIEHISEIGYREALSLKTKIRAIAGIGSGVGISGSAQQSSPPTPAQLARMGTYSVPSQDNETVVIVAYSEYQFTIAGINNLRCASGSITLTVTINGVAVPGLTNLAVTSTPQNPLATAGNIVNVGDEVDFVFTNSVAPSMLKFTMKGTIT